MAKFEAQAAGVATRKVFGSVAFVGAIILYGIGVEAAILFLVGWLGSFLPIPIAAFLMVALSLVHIFSIIAWLENYFEEVKRLKKEREDEAWNMRKVKPLR